MYGHNTAMLPPLPPPSDGEYIQAASMAKHSLLLEPKKCNRNRLPKQPNLLKQNRNARKHQNRSLSDTIITLSVIVMCKAHTHGQETAHSLTYGIHSYIYWRQNSQESESAQPRDGQQDLYRVRGYPDIRQPAEA